MTFDSNKTPCRHCGYWALPKQLLKKNISVCNAYTFPCWFYKVWEAQSK